MLAYTIEFDFSNGPAYPTIDDRFTSELNKNVKIWNYMMEAEGFAMLIAGSSYNNGWSIIPVNTALDVVSGYPVCAGMANLQ